MSAGGVRCYWFPFGFFALKLASSLKLVAADLRAVTE